MEPWREEHEQLVVIFWLLILFHDFNLDTFVVFIAVWSLQIVKKWVNVSVTLARPSSDMMTFCHSPAGKTVLKFILPLRCDTITDPLKKIELFKALASPAFIGKSNIHRYTLTYCVKKVFEWYTIATEKILIEGVIHFLMHFLLFNCNHLWKNLSILTLSIVTQSTIELLGNKLRWYIQFGNKLRWYISFGNNLRPYIFCQHILLGNKLCYTANLITSYINTFHLATSYDNTFSVITFHWATSDADTFHLATSTNKTYKISYNKFKLPWWISSKSVLSPDFSGKPGALQKNYKKCVTPHHMDFKSPLFWLFLVTSKSVLSPDFSGKPGALQRSERWILLSRQDVFRIRQGGKLQVDKNHRSKTVYLLPWWFGDKMCSKDYF